MGNQLLYGPNQVAEFPQAGPQAANDSEAKNIPGRVIQYAGKKFRYVQFDNGTENLAPASGKAVYWKTLTPESGIFIVTNDESDGLGINMCAGHLQDSVVTDQYYTWIQVGGVVVDAIVAASTVADDKMIGGSTNGQLERLANNATSTYKTVGIALDAKDTAGTSRVLLQGLEW